LDNPSNKLLNDFFAQQSHITFALLFGSRINGIIHPQSDWDFAIWFNNSSVNERFIQKEQLRQQLAKLLTEKIDVIDLQTASLSLMSSVVENNIVLKGDDLLELFLFYKRVWSLEADFYWRLKQIELYQAETMCRLHQAVLDEARQRLEMEEIFSNMEKLGIIHALQVLIENAIGKAKHLLKIKQQVIPVSAYDVFQLLQQLNIINETEKRQWDKTIGFRNTVVHEYMNVSEDIVFAIVRKQEYQFTLAFLNKPFEDF